MHRRSVLVVDDDDCWGTTLCDLLGDVAGANQLNVGWQDSGAAALRWLEQESCDLIISDVDMPEMSGFELLSQVHDRHATLPMALMSARADAALTQAAAAAGALCLLGKPCQPDALAALLTRAQLFPG